VEEDSIITATSVGVGISVGGNSLLKFRNSTLSGTATDGSLIGLGDSSSGEIRDSTLTLISNEDGIRVGGSSRLNLRESTISCTCTDGNLVKISQGSSAEIRDANLTLNNGKRAIYVAESSDVNIRNTTIFGTATEELIGVTRVSNAVLRNESTLSQTGTENPDVSVSNLSFLDVWNNEALINKVDCYNKGYVSLNEGTVTDLATSCTE
jgi:hypothetical protein